MKPKRDGIERGVVCTQDGRFFVRLRIDGKDKRVGTFNTLEEANECARAWHPRQDPITRKAGAERVSSVRGVNWNKNLKKWTVRCMDGKKQIYIGSYFEKEEAEEIARKMQDYLDGLIVNNPLEDDGPTLLEMFKQSEREEEAENKPKQPEKCRNCVYGRWDGLKQYCGKIVCVRGDK